MFKTGSYVALVILLLAAPAVITSVYLARYFNATLLDCTPDHGLLGQCDEMHYWEEIDCFKEAGFNGGYFVINERPARARWTHFGPHGPGFPVAYGLLGRAFGWHLAAAPLFNVGVVAFASAGWLWLVRPTTAQLAAAALVALTFWPCFLYVPVTMQECLHCALAFGLAGLAHRSINGRGRSVWPFVALAAAASAVRITWAVVLVPWAAIAMAGEKRRGRVLVLAAVPALFLAWQYVTSPFPNAAGTLLANLRERPAAAVAGYLAHVDRNLSTIFSRFAGSIATVYQAGSPASLRSAFALPLSMVARFQIAALLLVGAVTALRLLPPTRPLAAGAVAGVLVVLAVATGTQVPVACAIAAAGCWPGAARANRPATLAVTCAAVLGLVLVTHYDAHLRGLVGRARVAGLYLVLLAGLCWVHRCTVAAVLHRLAGPLFPPPSDGRPYLFAWLNVALVSALVVGLYDVRYDRDCRVVAPHLLLSVLVLLSGPAYRFGVGLTAVGLLAMPGIGAAFAERHHDRFTDPGTIDLRPYLRFDGDKSAWDNTLLVSDGYLKPRLRVPPGFGVSTVVESEDKWGNAIERKRVRSSPRSRYLFLRPGEAAEWGGPHLQLLHAYPYGNLYLNPDRCGTAAE